MSTTTISAIHHYPYRLPFAKSFTTAHGSMHVREGAIVRIETSAGISGIGEIAPLPAFGKGNLANALALLPEIAAQLTHHPLLDALNTLAAIHAQSSLSIGNSVGSLVCGLEIALLDALGKQENC